MTRRSERDSIYDSLIANGCDEDGKGIAFLKRACGWCKQAESARTYHFRAGRGKVMRVVRPVDAASEQNACWSVRGVRMTQIEWYRGLCIKTPVSMMLIETGVCLSRKG